MIANHPDKLKLWMPSLDNFAEELIIFDLHNPHAPKSTSTPMTNQSPTFSKIVTACQAVLPVQRWRQHRSVVAVSGGADSVLLLRVLAKLKELHSADRPPLVVGHINHGLRGEKSLKEQDFVRQLANQCGAEFFSRQVVWEKLAEDDRSDSQPHSQIRSENQLRQQRYRLLKEIAETTNSRYLFTGHQQDDQVETILFRVFRGTGLAGLRGIPAIRVQNRLSIVRPMLEIPRSMIQSALAEIGQAYVTDPSNDANHYSRNFLRNEILPAVRDYFGPHVDDAVARLAVHSHEALSLQDNLVQQFFNQNGANIDANSDSISIPKTPLCGQPQTIVRSILIQLWQKQNWPLAAMTFRHWQTMVQAIFDGDVNQTRQPGTEAKVLNLPGDVRMEVDEKTVRLERKI